MWRSASDSLRVFRAMRGLGAATLVVAALVFLSGGARGESWRVYDGDARFEVVRFDRQGRALDRYTGFSEITDIALYGDDAFLVVEERPGRVSAVSLDGRLLWQLHLDAARTVSVVGEGRLLVCQSHRGRVVEVDPEGKVFWELTGRFEFPAGAVRLPDGNTAVVEGRKPFGVCIVDKDGRELWRGVEFVMQPRSLTRLPNGELATSGFDFQHAVIYTPYTDKARWIDHCPHSQSMEATPDGDLLLVSPEHQAVRLWRKAQTRVWEFRTLYPPGQAAMLPDGTVLVSIERVPDREHLNAARECAKEGRPVVPYLRWMGWGSLAALVLAVLLRGLALLDAALGLGPKRKDGDDDSADAEGADAKPTALGVWRRAEFGTLSVVFVALVAWAAWLLAPIQVRFEAARCIRYFCVTGAAGVVLTWLAYRVPLDGDAWLRSLRSPAGMARPRWGMVAMWVLGLVAAGVTWWEVWHADRVWTTATWAGGILLLVLGSVERPRRSRGLSPWAFVGFVLLFAPVVAIRLWGLDAWPPNLHHDMALTSLQAFLLLDGEAPKWFANGWAKIPIPGYGWQALWAALFGRSLAAARLEGAISGILALLGVYVLVRRMYGKPTAAVAVLLLGVSHAFLHYSRIQAYMAPVAFQVVAVAALVEAISTGRTGWFALSGAACGYSALCYHSGRVTPVVLLLISLAFLARHPRLFRKRLPGFLLAGVIALAVVAPQGIVYMQGKADAMGRSDQFPWSVGIEPLETTVRTGLGPVFGTFHFFRDRATQYGDVHPGMFPIGATLLVTSVILALLRLGDVRNTWLLLWALAILIIGGVLTGDPPFWPRIIGAWVPATILAARPLYVLGRTARASAGRWGVWIVSVLAVGVVATTAWWHLSFYRDFCHGIAPGETKPRYHTQWPVTLIGRDLRQFVPDSLIYLVARRGETQGAGNASIQFLGRNADMIDTRDVSQRLPFPPDRPVVCYFLPEMRNQVKRVLDAHPDAMVEEIKGNLGEPVATRVILKCPVD